MRGPFAVTATVCSKWAETLRSAVTTVQRSGRVRTPAPPRLNIGSMASTRPYQLEPLPPLAVVGDLRLLVGLEAHAVPDELADHAVALLVRHLLDGRAHVAQP